MKGQEDNRVAVRLDGTGHVRVTLWQEKTPQDGTGRARGLSYFKGAGRDPDNFYVYFIDLSVSCPPTGWDRMTGQMGFMF